jgi:valyl-tRNA synthetase
MIPIIADELVDPDFGTGAVKVTAAHDPNDFEMAVRHNIPFVVIMNEHGVMQERAQNSMAWIALMRVWQLLQSSKRWVASLQKSALTFTQSVTALVVTLLSSHVYQSSGSSKLHRLQRLQEMLFVMVA